MNWIYAYCYKLSQLLVKLLTISKVLDYFYEWINSINFCIKTVII